MDDTNELLCPQTQLDDAVERLRSDDEAGLAAIAALLVQWPLDARLHFLQGSVLAGLQHYDDGRRAMARAVEIAPDFALARFQLGFLDLTCGRALDAMGVWTPLGNLPDDEPLRLFAEGLTCLSANDFDQAERLLRRGVERNAQSPLVNADMQLILDEIATLREAAGTAKVPGDPALALPKQEDPPPLSAAHMLLQQSRLKGGGTVH